MPFGQKKKPPTKQKYGKYGNPFKLTPRQRKEKDLETWTAVATMIKASTNTPTSVREIAAELYEADQQRQINNRKVFWNRSKTRHGR